MSMRRSAKKYLRGAERTSRDSQELLSENPLVAAAGSLLLNAVMQSKYGPTLQRLLNLSAGTAAKPADCATAEEAAPLETAA